MPDAPLIALTKAVVEDLNAHAGSFSEAPAAVRGYVPTYSLAKDLGERRVVVVPGGSTGEIEDRGHLHQRHRVLIGILKRLPADAGDTTTDKADLTALDAELAYVDELRRYFAPDDATIYTLDDPDAQLLSLTADPAYDHEALHERRQFQAVLTLEFEEARG